MKRILAIALLASTLCVSGCGLSTAAKLMKSYRISLGAFQDAEISTYQAGFLSAPQHIKDQADIEKLADYGVIADTAILSSDKATLVTDIGNGLTVVASVEANDVTAISDQTKRAEVAVTVAALQNLLSQVSIALGVKN